MSEYEHQIYETAFVQLGGGKYTRADIKAIVDYFDSLDKDNAKAIKETGGEIISVIEKPEGFDRRDRRSEKSKKAADWTPADALFDAAQAIKAEVLPCKQLLIIWWEELPNEKRKFHWRNATSSSAEVSHLVLNMLLDAKEAF